MLFKSIKYNAKTRYLMLKLIHFIVFVNMYTHSKFDACNWFQKCCDGACLPLC